MNTHGLGFDPFLGSRAFEQHKTESSTSRSTKRSRGIAFGVGILEETDTFGEIGDYVDPTIDDRINFYDVSDESDHDASEKRHSK